MTEQNDIKNWSLPATDMLNKTALSEAVKEMFNSEKIDMITDLTDDEIKLITRIYIVGDIKGITIWNKGVKDYLKLLLSRKRKSRSELLQAIEGAQKKTSLIDSLFNRGNAGIPK